jgi:hypothetical protein
VPFVEDKTKQLWEKERRKTLLPLSLCSAAWRGRKIFGPKSDRVSREWRRLRGVENYKGQVTGSKLPQ